MWFLYQALLATVLAITAPFLLIARRGHHLPTLRHRLGLGRGPAAVGPSPLWIHAVSVGEVNVARTLIQRLDAHLPLVVTTVTPTGQDLARSTLDQRAAIGYLPFDLGPCVDRFLRRIDPRALLLVEGELWPLLMSRLQRRGRPIYVVNGRISDRSFRRLRRLRRLIGPLLNPVQRFCVQTDEDRRRLRELGVNAARIVVTGNLKFESRRPTPLPQLEESLRTLAAGRPVLVAGSTMDGEDEQLLEAVKTLGLLLVLAPRHPERWNSVEALCRERELTTLRRTELDREPTPPERPEVLLLDSIGELAALYRVADIAFVGGTLVPTGGHNPLEPAQFGCPLIVGPSMQNFREIEELFDQQQAWARARDSDELSRTLRSWIDEPERAAAFGQRAQQLLENNRGAVERTIQAIPELAGGSAAPS